MPPLPRPLTPFCAGNRRIQTFPEKKFLHGSPKSGIIYYALLAKPKQHLRAWRNWQTRTVQVRMGATPWRFKSSRPHHFKAPGQLDKTSWPDLFLRPPRRKYGANDQPVK